MYEQKTSGWFLVVTTLITAVASIIVAAITSNVTLDIKRDEVAELKEDLIQVQENTKKLMGMKVPVGTIVPFAGEINYETPKELKKEGWLLCIGEEVEIDSYNNLWKRIGVTYGTSPNPTKFKLPDLQQRFLLGNIKKSGVTGTKLGDTGGKLNHTHDIEHRHELQRFDTEKKGKHDHVMIKRGAEYKDDDIATSDWLAGDGKKFLKGSVGGNSESRSNLNKLTGFDAVFGGYGKTGNVWKTEGVDGHSHPIPKITLEDSSKKSSSESNPPYLVVNFIIKY